MRFQNPKAYLTVLQDKGRAVLAMEDMSAGTTVEISPVLPFTVKKIPQPENFELWDYELEWQGEQDAIGLGLLSMYNHSSDSNVEMIRDFDEQTIEVRTKRAVKQGEELCIDYGVPLWFAEIS